MLSIFLQEKDVISQNNSFVKKRNQSFKPLMSLPILFKLDFFELNKLFAIPYSGQKLGLRIKVWFNHFVILQKSVIFQYVFTKWSLDIFLLLNVEFIGAHVFWNQVVIFWIHALFYIFVKCYYKYGWLVYIYLN